MTDFTKSEKRFIRRAMKNGLAELHAERQEIASDDLVTLIEIEDKIAVLESAWVKLKESL